MAATHFLMKTLPRVASEMALYARWPSVSVAQSIHRDTEFHRQTL